MNPLLETAMQMILCLLIAALIGAIIGYLIGKIGKCPETSDIPSPSPLKERVAAATEAERASRQPDLEEEEPKTAVQALAQRDMEHFEGERPPLLPAPRNGIPDDLKEISGIGLKIEDLLHELGIFHFDQIARWTKENIRWIEQYLNFKGRVDRENWVGQAKILSAGQQHREVRGTPDIQKKS